MAQATIISAQTRVAGRIEGSEDVAVEGHVEGTILLSEVLFIAPTGFVRGDATAREVHIEGSFAGELRAHDRVVLAATARVRGNIIAPLLEMAEGAQLAGELEIGDVEGTSQPRPARKTVSRPGTTRTSTVPARSPDPGPVTTPVNSGDGSLRQEESRAATTTVTVEEPSQAVGIDEDAYQDVDDDYTVKELREELRRRDLAVSGTKAELIERLLESDAEEGATH